MANFFYGLADAPDNLPLWNVAPSELKEPVVHAGILLKHSRKGNMTAVVERYFYIQGGYLLYQVNTQAAKPLTAMNLKFASVSVVAQASPEVPPEYEGLTIKVVKGVKFSLLFARNKSELREWLAALSKYVTRSDMHERYSVESIIGSGGFAQVLKAKELATGRYFAVKGFCKQAVQDNPRGIESLWKEIEILRSIQGQRNVVGLHEVHETKNSIYLIMEIVEGGDLLKLIRSSPVSRNNLLSIAYGLLKGLEVCANQNILHRDLKPSNIMIRKNTDITPEDVVLVDFGLAAFAHDKKFTYKRCGTPGYIAPELIAMRNVEGTFAIPPKCDLYSAGVVLYALCTGEPLFDKPDTDCNMILRRNLQSKVSFPEETFKTFGPEVVDLIAGLLQAKPEKRLTLGQAMNHRAFDYLKEESLDSSTEESDCEESFDPVLMLNLSLLFPMRLPPWMRRAELGAVRSIVTNRPTKQRVRGRRFSEAQDLLHDRSKMADSKDTVLPNSPVTSQSNGINGPSREAGKR